MKHSYPTRCSSDLYKYSIVDSLCGMVMFVGMNKILLVTSSALGEHSTSRRIAQRLVEAASEQGLHKILERDLRSLAHVDLELLRALRTEEIGRASCRERVCQYV